MSLTNKDLIATFNWDPLLLQAYQRVQKITNNLPQLAFLHGNVFVGVCHEHKTGGLVNSHCPKCGKPYNKMRLLYPVKDKNYSDDQYIAYETSDIKLNITLDIVIGEVVIPEENSDEINKSPLSNE